MALKRINKELTDLGRYVRTLSLKLRAGLWVTCDVKIMKTDNAFIVIHLLHAQRDLSAMILYVNLVTALHWETISVKLVMSCGKKKEKFH